MSGGGSVFLIITPVHAHRNVQQLRRHIRRNPRRHAPIRRNVRPRTLQTAPKPAQRRTGSLNGPILRETPPTNQTTETVKSRNNQSRNPPARATANHYAAGTIHEDRPCLHISMYTSTGMRHRPNAFSIRFGKPIRPHARFLAQCMAGYSSPMQGSHTGSGVPSRSVPLGSPLAAKLVQYSPIRLARS